VNNVASLRIIEESRRAVFGRPAVPGCSDPGLLTSLDGHIRHVVRRQVLEYRAEMWLSSGPLTVRHRVAGIGTTSFVLTSEIYPDRSSDVAVRAEAIMVLIDAGTRRPLPLPPELRTALSCRCWQPRGSAVSSMFPDPGR
jgi:acyl-CoA thioesterase FadM